MTFFPWRDDNSCHIHLSKMRPADHMFWQIDCRLWARVYGFLLWKLILLFVVVMRCDIRSAVLDFSRF